MGGAAGPVDAVWSIAPPPRCVACGKPLGRLDAAVGQHCRTLSCRTVVAVRHDLERRRLAEERDEAAASAHFADRDVVPIRLPAVTQALGPADPDRAAAFAASLAGAMAEAAARSDAREDDASGETAAGSGSFFGTACRTCGGHCCRHGATHAFVTADLLAARLAGEPGATPGALVSGYLARLPALSVEGSCVFHGEHGCTLERRQRSDVCNDYMCDGIRRLTMHLMGERPLGLAAVEDGRVVRAAVMDA